MLTPKTFRAVEPSHVPVGLLNPYARSLRPSSCVYMQFEKQSSPEAKAQYFDYKKQLKKWLRANMPGKTCCVTATGGRSHQIWVLFESEGDAMMFKLAWS